MRLSYSAFFDEGSTWASILSTGRLAPHSWSVNCRFHRFRSGTRKWYLAESFQRRDSWQICDKTPSDLQNNWHKFVIVELGSAWNPGRVGVSKTPFLVLVLIIFVFKKLRFNSNQIVSSGAVLHRFEISRPLHVRRDGRWSRFASINMGSVPTYTLCKSPC